MPNSIGHPSVASLQAILPAKEQRPFETKTIWNAKPRTRSDAVGVQHVEQRKQRAKDALKAHFETQFPTTNVDAFFKNVTSDAT
jgi:hypothetical protein